MWQGLICLLTLDGEKLEELRFTGVSIYVISSDLLLLSKTHCEQKHWKTSIQSVFHCPLQANSVMNGIYLEAFVLYLILNVEGSLLTPSNLNRGYLGLFIDIKFKGACPFLVVEEVKLSHVDFLVFSLGLSNTITVPFHRYGCSDVYCRGHMIS